MKQSVMKAYLHIAVRITLKGLKLSTLEQGMLHTYDRRLVYRNFTVN
jgi:hypothetical protein